MFADDLTEFDESREIVQSLIEEYGGMAKVRVRVRVMVRVRVRVRARVTCSCSSCTSLCVRRSSCTKIGMAPG